jgi:hypothetical protein
VTFEGSGWRLLALAGFTLLALACFSFTIDDSYIALRYGRNLAAGFGPVFDAQPPREGYSSPLWILVAALPFSFHLSDHAAVVAVKAAGLALGALTLVLAGLFAQRRSGDARAGNLAALLLACMPWMAFWSVSGLETTLYCALLMWALLRHDGENAKRRAHVLSSVPLVLLALTRPEGIVVAAAVLLADPIVEMARGTGGQRAALKRATPAFLILGACWLVFESWRVMFYGAFLPSTFLARSGLTVHDLKMRSLELLPFALYVTPLILAIAWIRPLRAGLTNAAWAAGLAQVAFAMVPRLESGPGFRYELPLLPLLAASAGAALGAASRDPRTRVPIRAAVSVLLLFLLAPMAWLRQPSRYSPSPVEISFGRWLGSYAPDARLAVYDLGAVPYFSAAPLVFDTNAAGPLSPFLGRSYDVDALLAWSPSFLILPPDEGTVAFPFGAILSRPAFRHDYAPLFELEAADGYRMTVWKRRDVRLRDGALEAAEAAGLYQRRVSRSTGGSPKYSYAFAVATRPRDVRSRNPAWMRNGSWMSSSASRSSLSAAARLPTPTGPPPNFSMIVRNSRRSTSSKPCSSTSSIFSAFAATSAVIVPSARTCA